MSEDLSAIISEVEKDYTGGYDLSKLEDAALVHHTFLWIFGSLNCSSIDLTD